MDKECNEEHVITLKVKKSAISSVDSGVARMHTSHLDCFEDEDLEMVVIRHEKKSVVVKLVSDRLAPMETITLRPGDMESLKIKEGEEVTIEPYHKMTDDIKGKWDKFVKRFKKDEDEEEGGD
ncbi:MAG: hypothetical protein ACMUIE_02475 [Thermoplasmatota archaeon]